jgi:hypothetical protein
MDAKSLSGLDLATVIGGIGGYLALLIALLQWYFYIYIQRPKIRLLEVYHVLKDIGQHNFMISFPIQIINYRNLATSVDLMSMSAVVKTETGNMRFVCVGSQIRASTHNEIEEEQAFPTTKRPFIRIEPYGCRLAQLNFALPSGDKVPSDIKPEGNKSDIKISYKNLSGRRKQYLKIQSRVGEQKQKKN